MRRSAVAAAGLAPLLPQTALAHAGHLEGSWDSQLSLALTIPLTDPRPVVTLLALGLMLALCLPPGLRPAWPVALGAAALGIAAAPLAPPGIVAAMLGLAALCAVLAVAWPGMPDVLVLGLLAVTLAVLAAASLQGFLYSELSTVYRLGIGLGLMLGVFLPGLAGAALKLRWPGAGSIALRIGASWCAAISIMLAAFEVR